MQQSQPARFKIFKQVDDYLSKHLNEMKSVGLLEIMVRKVLPNPEVAFIVKEEVFDDTSKKWYYTHWIHYMEDLEQMEIDVNVVDKPTFQESSKRPGWQTYYVASNSFSC
ncbi:hypothetical protein SeMB42_g03731 [Synchytrium endobioticum]|uniref:Uncharacterized protein n=1 Tax=Synchytrium endobioticum TaxID=286115 RepID=A0A507D4W4_9FUNG|nr:hypothetical protein SeLEV6574_g03517 [Synchytrium endobioticum]TPX46367.1 hypothetical protein SeMB42_g03731 [Synchytrium endobioticum]